jgi:hypothetical protein
MNNTRQSTYIALMNRAATGDHDAARRLLEGGWLPGLPTDEGQRVRLIDYARSVGYGAIDPNRG